MPGGPAPVKLWVEQVTGAGRSAADLIQEFTQVPALPQQASILKLQGWLQVCLHKHTLL